MCQNKSAEKIKRITYSGERIANTAKPSSLRRVVRLLLRPSERPASSTYFGLSDSEIIG